MPRQRSHRAVAGVVFNAAVTTGLTTPGVNLGKLRDPPRGHARSGTCPRELKLKRPPPAAHEMPRGGSAQARRGKCTERRQPLTPRGQDATAQL
jgi:hypothetical protein